MFVCFSIETVSPMYVTFRTKYFIVNVTDTQFQGIQIGFTRNRVLTDKQTDRQTKRWSFSNKNWSHPHFSTILENVENLINLGK